MDFNASGATGIDDDPVDATATVAPDGLGIEAVVELGDGTVRTIPIERFNGTCDDLPAEL